MTQNNKDHLNRIKDRIKKLLEVANHVSHDGSVDSQHERDVAMKQAYKLMSQYSLESLLDKGEQEEIGVSNLKYTFYGYMAKHSRALFVDIAYVFGCKMIILKEWNDDINDISDYIDTIGRAEDLIIVDQLHDQLYSFMIDELNSAQKRTRREKGSLPTGFSDSFCMMYRVTVLQRLREMYSEAVQEASDQGKNTELVLARSSDAIDKAFTEKYPNVCKNRSKSRFTMNREGMDSGTESGKRADIGVNSSRLAPSNYALEG